MRASHRTTIDRAISTMPTNCPRPRRTALLPARNIDGDVLRWLADDVDSERLGLAHGTNEHAGRSPMLRSSTG